VCAILAQSQSPVDEHEESRPPSDTSLLELSPSSDSALNAAAHTRFVSIELLLRCMHISTIAATAPCCTTFSLNATPITRRLMVFAH
jgi:hypothetical protein